MESANFAILQKIMHVFLLGVLSLIFFSPSMAREMKELTVDKIPTEIQPKTYVVRVKNPAGVVFSSSYDVDSWYRKFLPSMSATYHGGPRFVHTYRNVFSGFAVKLTADEAQAMAAKEGVLSAREEKIFSLHTTHTPSFLGLSKGNGLWGTSNLGKGVIIGVLDTGITPGHPSFSGENMPPPPAKWKGRCDFTEIPCNNKLIGARNFVNGGGGEPFDEEGHGTHTSSTAAGNVVKGAAALGNAKGTATGIAPLAHLAMYRVCSEDGCAESDILAAMDAAIDDGVDVLSLSLGGGSSPFFVDSIAVGAFAAIQKGIFVSCSAGNDGPAYATLSNEAPWILTVGASTVDRSIRATVKLGNGNEYDGESIFQPKNFGSTLLPLVYAGADGNQTTAFCSPGSLKNLDVKNKVVLCDRGGGVARIDKGQEVKNNGGAAMILANQEQDGFSTLADAHVLPATHVSFSAGSNIKAYLNSSSSPMATILFKGTVIGDVFAPSMASFSSRGPNFQSPGILKPDIIGPGVSILAAWPFSLNNNSNTDSNFNIISGTSMSCPHLSGVAALLKASHPDWSPAATKSAIMTSSDSLNHQGYPIFDEKFLAADAFATGSGHVNPSKADDPGLIYDITPDDYIPYLCGLNYTDSEIEFIVQKKVSCSEIGGVPEAQLNYPSFSVVLGSESQSFTRTVTNVGPEKSNYSVEIKSPAGVKVAVEPPELSFAGYKQTATYKITFSRAGSVAASFSQGFINWTSDKHSVRTPLVVVFA